MYLPLQDLPLGVQQNLEIYEVLKCLAVSSCCIYLGGEGERMPVLVVSGCVGRT